MSNFYLCKKCDIVIASPLEHLEKTGHQDLDEFIDPNMTIKTEIIDEPLPMIFLTTQNNGSIPAPIVVHLYIHDGNIEFRYSDGSTVTIHADGSTSFKNVYENVIL